MSNTRRGICASVGQSRVIILKVGVIKQSIDKSNTFDMDDNESVFVPEETLDRYFYRGVENDAPFVAEIADILLSVV